MIYFPKLKENLCDSVECLNNGICSKSDGKCFCLTEEFYGESCQYCIKLKFKLFYFTCFISYINILS